jgi:hypothetical protein
LRRDAEPKSMAEAGLTTAFLTSPPAAFRPNSDTRCIRLQAAEPHVDSPAGFIRGQRFDMVV